MPRTPAPGAAPHLSRAALRWGVAAVLLCFVVLGAAFALTRAPQADEGHFASAGAGLLRDGRLAMPMWTAWLPTLDERAYAVMPLYFLTLAGWFELFGVGFESMRLYSVLWGVALVGGWTGAAWAATRDRSVALLTAVLVGLNYDVLNAASARYDVMCAALGACALASYLALRERSLDRAALTAGTLLAAACMTHPYGVFSLVGVGVFLAALDARRLRPRHLLLGAIPFLVALGAWGLYIAQDVAMFRSQFGGNAAGRLDAYRDPLGALRSELWERYVVLFGGWRPEVPAAMRLRLLLLAAYAAAVAACALHPRLRTPWARGLSVYALAVFLMLTFMESNRWYIYLIHAVPIYAACLAAAAAALLRRGGAARTLALAGTAAFVAFTVASVGYRARQDAYGRAFAPTVAYLRANVQPGERVTAGGEFGVGLGFADHVAEDLDLGFLTGRVPDLVVVDPVWERHHAALGPERAELRAYLDRILAEYRLVFAAEAGPVRYRVIRR